MRRIGTEQFVGFHGQGCQAVARAFQQSGQPSVRTGDLSPERLLLRGVQQQAAVAAPHLPCGADKTLPIQHIGREPCRQAIGAACAMEGAADGARGPVAGRNHQAAAAQPRIDLSFMLSFVRCFVLSFVPCPHSSVIRRLAAGRHSQFHRSDRSLKCKNDGRTSGDHNPLLHAR